MAQPKKRKHAHHTNTPKVPTGKLVYEKVIPVTVIIFILFGVGISYFAGGYNVTWLIAGGVIGGICGFFFGYQIAKGISKK